MNGYKLWFCLCLLALTTHLTQLRAENNASIFSNPSMNAAIDLKQNEVSKITLNAQATIRKPADQLQMSISVVTLSDKAEQALEQNSSLMQATVASLASAGLERTEYETGNFTIHPTYTPYPKDPSPDWKPSISGYEVTNSILILTDKLDMAGKLIDAANKAGANRIENIRFQLRDPHAFRDEVIKAATTNAINDARAIANAAGVRLGRILLISLDDSNTFVPRSNAMFMSKVSGESSTPITPGEVSLSATVSIAYEILK